MLESGERMKEATKLYEEAADSPSRSTRPSASTSRWPRPSSRTERSRRAPGGEPRREGLGRDPERVPRKRRGVDQQAGEHHELDELRRREAIHGFLPKGVVDADGVVQLVGEAQHDAVVVVPGTRRRRCR